ncbi:MAG: hypothetical protein P1U87_03110 [Verrucomicrobiales bacterium]|nr:hypothetical protein [Verrucomicrobiales bacterium]
MSRILPTLNVTAAIAGLMLLPTAPLASEAAEAPQEPASLLPTPVEPDQFAGLLDHSPFTRVLDLSETIRLTGVAVINGEQVATVRDREKGKSYVISGQPNKEGWKMVEVDPHIDLEKVSATISVNGGELVTLQFDEKQLHPEAKAKGIDGIQASEKNARRPPPTQEEKRKFGEWVRGRMSKMSDAQKKRVGQIMQEKMKANPKLTDRQKGEIFVKILDHVELEK